MAFEGLIHAWSNERTCHSDATYCVVDKPAGVAGEGAGRGSLTERLFEHGLGRLSVLSAVPERASGATLLARADSAADHAASLAPVRLTCVAAVEDWRLPPTGSLPL